MISTKDSGILIDSHLLLDAFSLFLLFCAQTFRFIWFIIQNSSFFNVIKPFIFCQVESGLMFLKPNLLNGADFCEWSPRRPLKSRLSAFTRGLGLEPPLTTVPHLQDQSMNAPAEWCRTLSPQRDDLWSRPELNAKWFLHGIDLDPPELMTFELGAIEALVKADQNLRWSDRWGEIVGRLPLKKSLFLCGPGCWMPSHTSVFFCCTSSSLTFNSLEGRSGGWRRGAAGVSAVCPQIAL